MPESRGNQEKKQGLKPAPVLALIFYFSPLLMTVLFLQLYFMSQLGFV